MNELAKQRIKASFKYTWPLYIISAVVIALLLNFIFGVTHKIPNYQTLTLFVSGDVTNSKKLNEDMLEKYQDKELKSFNCISVETTDRTYYSKLSVRGYNSADILIIPVSTLDNLVVDSFGLEFDESLKEYYQGYTLYQQEDIAYGVKLDKEKVKDYMLFPNEDCYMILNGKSENIGKYSSKEVSEHDNALTLVKDWGM